MNKILVADQEEAICMLYSEELVEEGYNVVTISDPKDFMQAVEAENPDLIVLDMGMVENSNDTLRRYIRRNLERTPIILTTTYTPCKESLEDLDADDIILKSSDLHELKAKIKKQLEGLKTSRLEMRQPHENQKTPGSHSGVLLAHSGEHCCMCNGTGESFQYSSHDNEGGTESPAR